MLAPMYLTTFLVPTVIADRQREAGDPRRAGSAGRARKRRVVRPLTTARRLIGVAMWG